MDRLRAGLPEGDSTRVNVAGEVDATPCLTISEATASTRVVTVSVTSDSRVVICARSGETTSERSVGPVTALDAAVAEQVATMVEATLDAMASRDSPSTESPRIAPDEALPTEAVTSIAPNTATLPTTDPPAAPAAHEVDRRVNDNPPRSSNAPSGYSLTFALEPIWWVDHALTIGARVGGQTVIAPPWFWFAIDLAYALPFGEQVHGLGADFSTFSVDTRLGYSVPLNATMTFDLAAGPRVEWLLVRPFAVSGSGATAGKGSAIFAAAATFDVGPRVQIGSRWFVALRVGAVFVNQPRAFGFESPDGFVTILDQAMPRVFARVEARAAL